MAGGEVVGEWIVRIVLFLIAYKAGQHAWKKYKEQDRKK